VVQKEFHDLVISTYGRGVYILDDITPLEQLARHRSDTAVVFFEPRKTYRFVRGGAAALNYSLTAVPKNPAQLEILDSAGNPVRKLEQKAVVGINRFNWDLRYESPRVVALRTVAPDNARIWQEPRFREADSRPITHWGSNPAEVGPIVAPGAYSVRLRVDGQLLWQTLVVVSDPRSPGSEADIELSVKTLLVIRDHISHVSDSVNQMEWLRKQLEVIQTMQRQCKPLEKPAPEIVEEDDEPEVEPPPAPPRVLSDVEEQQRKELLTAAENLDHKLQTVESRLVSRALRNSDDKYFVEADGVYLDLMWLNAEVGTGGGDVAGGADFAPTEAQQESLKTLESELAQADAAFTEILQRDLPAFNQTLEHANLTPLVVVAKRREPDGAHAAGPGS